MKEESLRAIWPEVYRPLLPDFFDHPAPHEEKATCESCAMCAPPGTPETEALTYFRPDAKCCTFHPLLPNYLVGAILADERPDMQEGKRRIRERIAMRIGVSPRWLAPPRKADLMLRAARYHAFGRSLVLLCPFFDRTHQNCTIWRHRESVCTTFYCKYGAGEDGETFWRALRSYGVWLETALSAHAVTTLIPGHKEPKPLAGDMTLEDIEDRPPSDATYEALWGEHAGREEELYVRSYEVVRALPHERFEELARGSEYATRLDRVVAAREAMLRPTLPERLVPNPEMTKSETESGVLVCSYSRYDPLMLTKDLFEVVRAFGEGGTVSEVRARLQREQGIEIPDEMLAGLWQFRVLIAPPAAP